MTKYVWISGVSLNLTSVVTTRVGTLQSRGLFFLAVQRYKYRSIQKYTYTVCVCVLVRFGLLLQTPCTKAWAPEVLYLEQQKSYLPGSRTVLHSIES